MANIRVSTGISGLDRILHGGFPEKTAILLSGGSGTGKTLVGLNFLLCGAAKGERCCYITLTESREEVLRACRGIDSLKVIEKYLEKRLIIKEILPRHQRSIVGGCVTMEEFVQMFDHWPSIDRLVIDNINKLLLSAGSSREYRLRFMSLVKFLKKKVGCTLFICETKDGIDSGNNESFECDGIINMSFLEVEEKPTRTLAIYKMKYTAFDPLVHHKLIIDKKSIRLAPLKVI